VDRKAEGSYAKKWSMPKEALDEARTATIAEGRECLGETKAALMSHVKAEKVRQWMWGKQETRAAEDLMWGQESNVDCGI
jgi:hypothetical protein